MVLLARALYDHHLIVLRVIGEWWEVDLAGMDKDAAVTVLADTLQALDLTHEMLFLPEEEVAALHALAAGGGRVPVAMFSRRYGDIRPMGPGKLEREEPWLAPESPAEGLWYRGFLYRGFDSADDEPVEYFYLPDELLAQLPTTQVTDSAETVAEDAMPVATLTAAAPAAVPELFAAAPGDAIDDLTALLSEVQRLAPERDLPSSSLAYLLDKHPSRQNLLLRLAYEMNLLRRSDGILRPARAAMTWLQQARAVQLVALMEAWSQSNWSELHHTPGLVCEAGSWEYDPIAARTTLLDAMPHTDEWVAIDALIDAIKTHTPDFQRPNGDYRSWYIRDQATDVYLSGFESWDDVEGRQLHFILTQVMFWLGMVDVADNAVRFSALALDWLHGRPPVADEVRVPLVVNADGVLVVPHNAGRRDRFQTSRIADPLPVLRGKPFHYRLTPASLERARAQGIEPQRVLAFLEEVSNRPIPAATKRALERWAENGVEARLESVVILRVRDAAVLDTLRRNPKTRPFIGEALGDLAAVVRRADWQALRDVTAQLGLLLAVDENESSAS